MAPGQATFVARSKLSKIYPLIKCPLQPTHAHTNIIRTIGHRDHRTQCPALRSSGEIDTCPLTSRILTSSANGIGEACQRPCFDEDPSAENRRKSMRSGVKNGIVALMGIDLFEFLIMLFFIRSN